MNIRGVLRSWRTIMAFGTLAMLFSACSSSGVYQPSEGDKLTPRETEFLVLHVRSFIKTQANKLSLKPEELVAIQQSQPRIRVNYTGYKEGRLSMEWTFEQKQFFAIAQGELLKTKDWRISVGKKADVIYYRKNSPQAPNKIVSPKEFDTLRNSR